MNSIFKTGTFGFSTILSTPCDYAADEYFKRTQSSAKSSLACDLMYEVSNQSESESRSKKSKTSTASSSKSPNDYSVDEQYDEIYQAYSKIWKEQSTSTTGRTVKRTVSNQENRQVIANSFSLATESLQSQANTTGEAIVYSMNINTCPQQEVKLNDCINKQQMIDDVKKKIECMKSQFANVQTPKANIKPSNTTLTIVDTLAQQMIYMIKVYSIEVTNQKLNSKENSFPKKSFTADYTPQIYNNVQRQNSSTASNYGQKFSSPCYPQMNMMPATSQQFDYSTQYNPTKHMTRQHLVQNIRQPLFPLNNFENQGFVQNQQNYQKAENQEDDYQKIIEKSHQLINKLNFNNNNNGNIIVGDALSQKTHGGVASNSSRTKDDEHDFDLSFDEDFFLDLQKGGLELDE